MVKVCRIDHQSNPRWTSLRAKCDVTSLLRSSSGATCWLLLLPLCHSLHLPVLVPIPSHFSSLITPQTTMSRPSRSSSISPFKELSASPSPSLPDEGYDEQRLDIPKWVKHWSDEQKAGKRIYAAVRRAPFVVGTLKDHIVLIQPLSLWYMPSRVGHSAAEVRISLGLLEELCAPCAFVRIPRLPCASAVRTYRYVLKFTIRTQLIEASKPSTSSK